MVIIIRGFHRVFLNITKYNMCYAVRISLINNIKQQLFIILNQLFKL